MRTNYEYRGRKTQRVWEWLDMNIGIQGEEIGITKKKMNHQEKQHVADKVSDTVFNANEDIFKGVAMGKITRIASMEMAPEKQKHGQKRN